MFPYELILTDVLGSRLGRLCSHPYCFQRRALPATYPTRSRYVSGLSSLGLDQARLPDADLESSIGAQVFNELLRIFPDYRVIVVSSSPLC